MREVYTPSALTGGTSGCLDAISPDVLNDGDVAFVMTGTTLYVLQYVATATDAESSPSRIRPDSYSTAGVWYLQQINDQTPIGSVVIVPFSTPPSGFLECDGSAISRTTYAALYGIIGTTYGSGDGATTYNLPDFRGQFLRGWAHGQTTDPDRASRTDRGDGTTGDNVGTKQSSANLSHTHPIGFNAVALGGSTIGGSNQTGGTVYSQNSGTSTDSSTEARPKNINVMYCIKY